MQKAQAAEHDSQERGIYLKVTACWQESRPIKTLLITTLVMAMYIVPSWARQNIDIRLRPPLQRGMNLDSNGDYDKDLMESDMDLIDMYEQQRAIDNAGKQSVDLIIKRYGKGKKETTGN